MAGFSFNISLGREVEFYNRVDTDDPVNSALILLVLTGTGLEADSVLRDYDLLSTLLAASNNEVTNTNYARKTLTQADLTAIAPDDTNNTITLTLAAQTFATILAGDNWAKALLCWDSDTTAGTDANVIPVKAYDVLAPGGGFVAPNGQNIVFTWPSGIHIARAASA